MKHDEQKILKPEGLYLGYWNFLWVAGEHPTFPRRLHGLPVAWGSPPLPARSANKNILELGEVSYQKK